MMNYEPRYRVSSPDPNEFVLLEHKNAVDRLVQTLGSTVKVEDRGLAKPASTAEGAWYRGYYNMRYNGTDSLSYQKGKIARSADKALDRLDDLAEQMRVDFERRHSIVKVI